MQTFADYGIDVQRKTGEEVKATCPRCSGVRKKKNYPCLNVNTVKGVWHCWHCGWSGALQTGEYQKPDVNPPKVYKKPSMIPARVTEKVLNFFTQRKISPTVVMANKITTQVVYMPQVEEEVEAIAFPFFKGGDLVNIKYRDKDKNFRQVAGAEKVLYKYDSLAETTILCEGEMDALSIETAGFANVVSVPDGAPNPSAKDLDNKFSFLTDDVREKVKHWLIAVDADAPGEKLKEEFSRRVGRENCSIVTYPEGCKDANDVLVKHGVDRLKECIDKAKPYPIEGVFSIDDISTEILSIIEDGLPKGLDSEWTNVNELYRPVERQWTLVTGIPSMGKSEWLDALLVEYATRYGYKFAICSPENQPMSFHAIKYVEKKLGFRVRQGTNRLAYTEALDWVGHHFHFILPEVPTVDSILAKATFCVRKYGVRGLVIDPYNELDHTDRPTHITETEYISLFLSKLRKFARDNDVHVWLVAHPQKLLKGTDGKYPVPDGYSIAGSAHFVNKADCLIAVHRDTSDPTAPTEIHVQKMRSRWLGQRGVAHLWWQHESGRFTQNNPHENRAKKTHWTEDDF